MSKKSSTPKAPENSRAQGSNPLNPLNPLNPKPKASSPRWTFTEFGSEQLITFVAMATPDDLNATF